MAAAIATTSGCLGERSYVDPSAAPTLDLNGSAANANLTQGHLTGDFGPRTGIDGAATMLQGQNDREFDTATVNLAVSSPTRGAGMIILSLNKSLDSLPAGRHTFGLTADGQALGLAFVNHCSGATTDSIDYDQPATSGTITVTEQTGTTAGRLVDVVTQAPKLDPVTGSATSQVETSHGSFVYTPSN
jgi:hypothetical protein